MKFHSIDPYGKTEKIEGTGDWDVSQTVKNYSPGSGEFCFDEDADTIDERTAKIKAEDYGMQMLPSSDVDKLERLWVDLGSILRGCGRIKNVRR